MNGRDTGMAPPVSGVSRAAWERITRRDLLTIVEAVSEPIAVISDEGIIQATNAAWHDAEALACGLSLAGVGDNLLERWCLAAAGGSESSGRVLGALRGTLSGAVRAFEADLDVPGRGIQRMAVRGRPSGGAIVAFAAEPTGRASAPAVARQQIRVRLTDAREDGELVHLARVATMGELLASIAHELSQPLTAILANAQAARRLLSGEPPDMREAHAALGDIAEDDMRAAAIIERLRQMLRKSTPVSEPIEFNGVVESALALVRHDVEARGVALRVELSPEQPLVTGDRIQLQQVVTNLVVNALDAATDAAAAAREVEVITAADAETAHLTVRDRGPGSAPGRLERLFEPFYTTKSHGLGMGLSISRSIIRAHGGGLSARRRRDGGLALHCGLPRTRPDVPSVRG